jgi:hypothetical protein
MKGKERKENSKMRKKWRVEFSRGDVRTVIFVPGSFSRRDIK